jgi:hypothetical protein
MIVGTEANEADLECHPRVREGVGGGNYLRARIFGR